MATTKTTSTELASKMATIIKMARTRWTATTQYTRKASTTCGTVHCAPNWAAWTRSCRSLVKSKSLFNDEAVIKLLLTRKFTLKAATAAFVEKPPWIGFLHYPRRKKDGAEATKSSLSIRIYDDQQQRKMRLMNSLSHSGARGIITRKHIFITTMVYIWIFFTCSLAVWDGNGMGVGRGWLVTLGLPQEPWPHACGPLCLSSVWFVDRIKTKVFLFVCKNFNQIFR